MKREVILDVAGQALALRSDEDDEYLESLAAYVSDKMDELGKDQQAVTTVNLALTAALAIADEFHKLRKAQEGIDEELDRMSDDIEVRLGETGR